MSARTKLNAVMLGGGLLVAATIGAISNSWLIFAIVAIITGVLMVHAGEVRIGSKDHRIVLRGGRKESRR